MLTPFSLVSAGTRPASNWACANGFSEPFKVDCSALVISPEMRGPTDCAPAIKVHAAIQEQAKSRIGRESSVVIIFAILGGLNDGHCRRTNDPSRGLRSIQRPSTRLLQRAK